MTDVTDATIPAGKSGAKGMAVVSAAIFILILAVVFVLPGFVVAGFSRANITVFTSVEEDPRIICAWCIQDRVGSSAGDRAIGRAARWFLVPVNLLQLRSSVVRSFYAWEFQAAGGHGAYIIPSGDVIDPNEREEPEENVPAPGK
jgi:hypothetical protein